jgi:anti-sigma regulatory factor (Ser/Thr protein kinase)
MPSSAQKPSRLNLEARNTIPEIAVAIERSVEFLRENGASQHVLFVSELALEELLTNIVKYGYQDSAPHEIAVELEARGDEVRLRLADDGTAFNPWDDAPEPVRGRPANARPLGGQGIMLVKKFANSLAYQRKAAMNVVTVHLPHHRND